MEMTENKLIIGTAPDSWGVWFADDPKQTPWERFLDEVAESGYKWIELGPYGYLPNDPTRLAEGLKQQFHSHADSHVGAQEDIETLLGATDPQYLNLCLDTGHAEYCGASSLELIKNYPDRIGYLHLKQINPDILRRVNEENMTWAAANLAGVMTEPPNGL